MMQDYSAIKYKNNFLNQVIIRVDFLQFLETEKLFCDDIEKSVLKLFTRRGMDQKIQFGTINVMIDSSKAVVPNMQKEALNGIQREYYDGKNKILLSNKYIIYEINDYCTFEDHFKKIQAILFALYAKVRITTARIGIRYINIFAVEEIKSRKNMFSNEISATFSAKEFLSEKNIKLIRAMSMNEYQVENMLLNFRFGLFNPDYPNLLTKDSLALDYDCYTTEPLETSDEVLRIITSGHDAIQELFETSITDSLRKVLSND